MADICNNCQGDLKKYDTYYDASVFTPMYGRRIWGLFCKHCFGELGGKLGVGRGQEFDSKTNVQIKGGNYDGKVADFTD